MVIWIGFSVGYSGDEVWSRNGYGYVGDWYGWGGVIVMGRGVEFGEEGGGIKVERCNINFKILVRERVL